MRNLFRSLIIAGAFLLAPGTAQADTLCNDGWLSPSDGGSGTCSWHGGILGNDNDSGGGWRIPVISNNDSGPPDPEAELFKKLMLYGAGMAVCVWLLSIDKGKE